jgi:hypothetical protein
MKKQLLFIATILIVVTGCRKDKGHIPKMTLLSGGAESGKAWTISNFWVTSTYGSDKSIPLKKDIQVTMMESVKDNSYIIRPTGQVIVDDGDLRWDNTVPQYHEGQTWTLIENESRVEIYDPVNLPSINGTYDITVTKDQIILYAKQVDSNKIDFAEFKIIFKSKR